ncbi:MAG: hypothetical protein SFU99_09725 [Saprospiraceae bacterium]|nr:hypothetical protein [Saprospiraceae bacterium]
MDLQILISKKGTKVVTATNLHQALQLLDHHYAANVKKWLNDLYEFRDGIRKPILKQDFAPRKLQDAMLIEDYFLSIELAKQIVLRSNSKVKLKYAKYLLSLEEEEGIHEQFDKEQVLMVLDLVKSMRSVSYQENCERRHLKVYEDRNGGSASNWWQHRAEVLGYSPRDLREMAQRQGKPANGKSQRQLLMQVDKYEMIRTGVIDLFMAMGKNEQYARAMGDMAKAFAEELRIEIYDDREAADLFAPSASAEPVVEMKKLENVLRMSA